MKNKAAKSIVLWALAIVMLLTFTGCGCKHVYEKGVCTLCGEADPNFVPCTKHSYVVGECTRCGALDETYVIRQATGSNGVVTSANPLASQVGLDILQAGGNAYDAAIAMAFALGVVEPNASGIGGGGLMLGYNNQAGEAVFYDFREFAPQAATFDAMGAASNYSSGAKAAAVPTEVAGLIGILDQEGSGNFTLAQLLQPTITLAEDGFKVGNRLSSNIFVDSFKQHQVDEAMAIYTNGIRALRGSETLTNQNYANVLKAIAQNGADGFYTGWVAESIINTVQQAGGFITQADLDYAKANFPRKGQALQGTYNGRDVYTSGLPTAGGIILLEALNMVESYCNSNATTLATLKHNTADYIHLVGTSLQMSYADKREYVADNSVNPATGQPFANVPVQGLISKDYAAARMQASFTMDKAFVANQTQDFGGATGVDPFSYNGTAAAATGYTANTATDNGTTGFAVVDKDGNVASFTQTINGYWGSYVMPTGTGFFLNNEMADFATEATSVNKVEPFKQPVSSMAPTIVVEEGKPILTVTCPGGAIIPTALLQVMLNVLELDMDMQTALEVARIQNVAYTEADENNIFTGDGSTHKLISVEKWAGGLSDEVVQQLTDKNYSVFKFSADGVTHVYGITINYDSDGKATMTGGADNRRDGVAMAY